MSVESKFQKDLIDELRATFPGAIVTKLSGHIQGLPDLVILWHDHWALLECKRSANEVHQPNQDYYVEELKKESFAAFIFPENKEEVLNELKRLWS